MSDRKSALVGADYVVVQIAVGGVKAWRQDLDIPWEIGHIYQTVGDTTGPGGIFRAFQYSGYTTRRRARTSTACRVQGILLPLPRHEDRPRASTTASCRRSTPRCCSAACCSRSRTSTATHRRGRDPRLADNIYRRVEWPWAQVRAPRITWAGRPSRASSRTTGAATTRHAGLCARARIADAPVGTERVERVDESYDAAGARSRARNTSASRRCSATSTRTSGSTFAASRTRTCAARHRLFREQPSRDATRSAPTRSPIPWAGNDYGENVWGLTACDGPGDAQMTRRPARMFRALHGARRRRRRHPRRRHDRADRGVGVDAVRAGDRDPGDAEMTRATGADLRDVRIPRCVQPSFTSDAAKHGRVDPGLRMGRRRLSRHRSGSDRRDDRELSRAVSSGRSCGAMSTCAAVSAGRILREAGSPQRRSETRWAVPGVEPRSRGQRSGEAAEAWGDHATFAVLVVRAARLLVVGAIRN